MIARALWLSLLLGPALAWADEPPGLEPYLPEGITARQLERALDDDLGSGLAGSMPLVVLDALVDLDGETFGDSVPAAYHRYGFLFLADRPQRPVGISEERRFGVRVHQFNCLVCHAGVDPASDRLVVGATNRGVDFGAWYGALFGELGRQVEALRRPDDTTLALTTRVTQHLAGAARRQRRQRGERLNLPELGLLGLMAQGYASQLLAGDADRGSGPLRYGPGRTVVQAAYRTLRFDLDPGPWAPVKAPDLFGVGVRETLLWTGNETYAPGTPAAERIARNGMLVPWIQLHPVTREPIPDWQTLLRFPRYLRMGRLLAAAAPPAAPAPADYERVRAGQAVFRETCAECHGDYELTAAPTPRGAPGVRAVLSAYPELIVPADEVGTDPAYTRANDDAFNQAFAQSLLGRARLFEGRVTGGYVARPLYGLRMRAPYLHNASVPNLRALLTPPAQRPRRFLVGHDVPADPEAVGLRHDPAAVEAASRGELRGRVAVRDTGRDGDRNQGHPFGTDLTPAQKDALLAFLRLL